MPADSRSIDDVDTGAVRQGRINNRTPVRDGTFDPFCHLYDKFIQLMGDFELYNGFETLENLMFDKDRTDTVTGYIFNIGIGKERLEHSHIDLIPYQQVLDCPVFFIGKDHLALGSEGDLVFYLGVFHFFLGREVRVQKRRDL